MKNGKKKESRKRQKCGLTATIRTGTREEKAPSVCVCKYEIVCTRGVKGRNLASSLPN